MSTCFPPEKPPPPLPLPHLPLPPPPPPRSPSDSRSRSGTPSLCGLGISWWTTVLSAGTTSWISALSARLIRLARQVRSALWLGVCATMHFTSIVLAGGSRPVKCAHLTTANGSSRSMVTRMYILPI